MRQVLAPLLLFTALHGTAQPHDAAQDEARTRTISSVRLFGMENGLPDRKVNALAEDARGFIWMATKVGLVRFDGNVFENHTRDHGLLQDAVLRVARDRDGLLWVMFMDSTVQLMDPLTRRPMSLNDHFGDLLPGVHGGPFASLGVSDDGLIVLGQGGHLIWYGGREQGFRRHRVRPKDHVEVLRVEDSGDLWCSVAGASSAFFDLVRISFTNGWAAEAPLITTVVGGIWHTGTGIDHSGSRPGGPEGIYFGTFHVDGWARPDGSVIPLPHRGEDLLPEAENRMHAHLGGDLWVVNARIRRMAAGDDPRRAEVVVDMHAMHPEVGHSVNAVLRDRTGRIWVGTDFGVLLVDLLPGRFQRWFRMDEMIHGYGTRTRGMQVVGGLLFVALENEGVLVADASSGEVLHEGGEVYPRGAVLAWGNELVWDLGSRGLLLRRARDGSVVRTVAPATSHGYVWSALHARDGGVLLGTNAGIFRLDDQPVSTRVPQPHFPEVDHSPIWHIAPVGNEWIACTSTGLYVLDSTGMATTRYWSGARDPAHRLPADDIRHLHVDDVGTYWLATATRGLARWDRRRGTSHLYGPSIGMPQAAIHAIYPDREGRLWMPTDNGLVRFHVQGERVEVFTTREGIAHNEFNRISHTRGPDGTLYFGGLNGITVFHPDHMVPIEPEHPAPLILKGIHVQPTEGGRLDHTSVVLDGGELVMRPSDRFINLDMVLLCYDEPHLVHYAWRVEGIDAEWNIQREPNLRFTTLPYGRHELRIRGIDREGRWSDELVVPIRVVRPVHLRWWFIAGAMLLVGAIVYAGVRYRIMQLRRVIAVRDRIAMDLHDEVGSNLSGIVLFSSVVAAQRDKLPAEAAELVERIARNSSRAIEDMNDIVWSVNSHHDELSDVVDRMQAYAQPLCDTADIAYTMDVQEGLRDRRLGMEQRRSLYLVFKEAVNNAVKHSACSAINVRLQAADGRIDLVVEDNGRGMGSGSNTDASLGGQGMGNMQRRADEVGGTLEVRPNTPSGTRILLRIPGRGSR